MNLLLTYLMKTSIWLFEFDAMPDIPYFIDMKF